MTKPTVSDSAERFLAAIVESSDDAIIGKDLDGIILTWNAGAERLYGYTEAEARGQSIAMLIPADRSEELSDILETVRNGGRIRHLNTRRRTRDGRELHVSLTISPVLDEQRRIIGAATIARDITPQIVAEEALRHSEQRWRAVIDSAVDAIVVIDARGLIESFNRSAERMFGYAEADVCGRNVSMLMPPPYRDEHDGYMARYQATHVPHIIGIGREVSARHRDGTVFPIHLSVGEMHLGGTPKFTGIIHDLRQRVEMEERLRDQAAMARLGEMAAVVAHEVKNPLAGIRGAIEVLGTRMPQDGRERAVVRQIVERIDGLNELVNDMLVFARPAQPRLGVVDLMRVTLGATELLRSDPAMSGIRIDSRGSAAPVTADAEQLKIIVGNLLVNSAQAMDGRGAILITFTDTATHATMTLHDSGPGIAADVLEKIFTPFFTTKARGTGLGLPTAKRLIEAQGGSITVTCPEGGGTLVTLTLPKAPTTQ